MAVSILLSRAPKRASARRKSSPWRRRLVVEQLEDRRLLSNGPVLVKIINPTGSADVGSTFAHIGDTIFFAATDGVHGAELWKSNGTAAGTVMVKDINPGPYGSYPLFGFTIASRYFSVGGIDGTLYFSANDGVHGGELWKTDGTTAGTVLVKDINPGPYGSYPTYFNEVKGRVLFRADGGHGAELWKTDGTAAGTKLVKDLVSIDFPAVVDGTLYFDGSDGAVHGSQLWKSDGTTAGTVMVKDINPGGNSFPAYFMEVNGRILFVAIDAAHGEELWTTDGTTAGTKLLKDINPGPGNSIPNSFMLIKNTLFFDATDGTHGFQLWKTDGTAAGTVMLTNTTQGGPGPRIPVNLDGTLIFEEFDEAGGVSLWRSDGTVAGTKMFADIKAGSDYPLVAEMVAVGDLAYFVADDGVHGVELWQTDGTAKGTHLTADLNPGPNGSLPSQLTNVDGTLYFFADDGVHGRQLWTIPRKEKDDPGRDLAFGSASGAAAVTGLGGIGIDALLPAASAANVALAKPAVASSKPDGQASAGGVRTAAFFAAQPVAPPHAIPKPEPGGADGLESSALDALFAPFDSR
jgi:ELWxxDGT repeat protein